MWKEVYTRFRSVKYNRLFHLSMVLMQNFRAGGTLTLSFINEKPEIQRHKVTWPRQSQDTH